MVNRTGNFNRQKVNRAKTIRDRKKARKNNKKKSIGYENSNNNLQLNKKQLKKQKRLNQILTDLGVDADKLIKKKHIKRRNKKSNEIKSDKMDVEE